MITDSSATIPLGLEPKETEHLKKPPRHPSEGIVSPLMLKRSVIVGFYMAVVALMIFNTYLESGLNYARTITFLFLSVSQWFNALNCRSEKKSVFFINPLSNKWLITGIMLGVLGQLVVMYVSFFENIFGFVSVGITEWLIAILASFGVIFVVEADKIINNLFTKRRLKI